MTAGVPARLVRRRIRAFRTSAGHSVIQAVAATYYTICIIGLGIGVFGPTVAGFLGQIGIAAPAVPTGNVAHAVLPAGGLVAAGFAVWLAQQYGPIVLKPAEVTWLLRAPVRRLGLVGVRVGWLSFGFAGGGAVVGLGLAFGGAVSVPGAVASVAVGSCAGLAVVVAAMLGQFFGEAAERVVSVLWSTLLVLGVAGASAVLVPSAAGGGSRIGEVAYEILRWSGPWGWPSLLAGQGAVASMVAGVGVLLAVALAGAVGFLLPRVPHASIASASARFAILAGAAMMMDPGSLATTDEARRAGRRRPRGRLAGGRWWRGTRALLAQDLLVLRRRWPRLVVALVLTSGPAMGYALGGTAVAALVLPAVAVWAARIPTGAAGRESDAPGLARLLAVDQLVLRNLRLIAPMVVGVVWAGLATAMLALVLPAGGLSWVLLGLSAAPGWALAALRMARRGPVRHDLPVMVTPAGLLPIGPLMWSLTGVDLAVLLTAPTIYATFAADPANSTVLVVQLALSAAGLAWPFLRRLSA